MTNEANTAKAQAAAYWLARRTATEILKVVDPAVLRLVYCEMVQAGEFPIEGPPVPFASKGEAEDELSARLDWREYPNRSEGRHGKNGVRVAVVPKKEKQKP